MFLMEDHNNAEVFAAASISNNVYNAAELLIPFSVDVLYRFLEIQTVLKSRFGHYNKYTLLHFNFPRFPKKTKYSNL